MKVKVNIINTWCIIMSEAITVPSLMLMTSTVSQESLARDMHARTHARTHRHTHPPTHTVRSSTLKFAMSLTTL